jgi:serine/threonine protein kinase
VPADDPSPGTLSAVASAVVESTASADPAPSLPVVDPEVYAVEGEHARGGLGRIVRARDRRLDRLVAIKELTRQGPSARARFEREARITARLAHPAIVPIYEAGRWPSGEPFYAMKLLTGRTLREVIDDARDLDARLGLLPHVLAVAQAVAYAHSQRVIHRDLKPANVLVGAFGETVVIDWGLARELDAPDGETGGVMGTPAYMPPEQAAGASVDERGL